MQGYVLVEDTGAISALVVHEDESIGSSLLGVVVRSADHIPGSGLPVRLPVAMSMLPVVTSMLLEVGGTLRFTLTLG